MRVREVVPNTPPATRGPRRAKRPGRRWRVDAEAATGTVLIVRHEGHAPGGGLIDALRARSLEPRILDADRDRALPDPRALALAIVLGSDPSAEAPHAELDWLRLADAVGTPVLALGAAATRLALAFGGRATPASPPRRAWVELTSADLRLLPAGPWLAWEDAVIDLPPEAELLAHDHLGPQAFRIGHHVGVQVNAHVTPEVVRNWVAGSSEVLDHQGILEATHRDHPGGSEAARRLFAGFVAGAAWSLRP